MDVNLQTKYINRQNGFKNIFQLYVVYEKLSLDLRTHLLKVKEWEKYFMQIGTKESRGD